MVRERTRRAELTVDELNAYIQGLFNSDLLLKALVISGEIAEFKRHTSGHCYFTLLGTDTRISCAMFRRDADLLPEWPRNGDQVLIEGSVGVYPQRGVYQLYARRLIPVGAGAIERARQELKRRLELEGLFHPSHKRPISPYPSRVAVITSATGAALRDVLRISGRRYPLSDIVVVPTLVQGPDAPEDIVRAFARAGAMSGVDCVLLVRGGGSREDLVPFDDERVVRAVRNCPFPVVSGIGHEVDSTLSDLAADLTASTPSAAAEVVFPDRAALLAWLAQVRQRVGGSARRRIGVERARCRLALEGMERALKLRTGTERSRLHEGLRALSRSMALRLRDARSELSTRTASLSGLSPLAALARGYVIAEREGRRLFSVREALSGAALSLCFRDGRADCLVRAIAPFDPPNEGALEER